MIIETFWDNYLCQGKLPSNMTNDHHMANELNGILDTHAIDIDVDRLTSQLSN